MDNFIGFCNINLGEVITKFYIDQYYDIIEEKENETQNIGKIQVKLSFTTNNVPNFFNSNQQQ